MLRAVLLLALLLGFGPYVESIPLAALAGVLLKVGWNIIDWRLLARILHIRREHLFVMLMTLGLTVFVDLLTAVAIGLIASGMAHARHLERLEIDNVVSVPMLDHIFLGGAKEAAGVNPYAARVGLVSLRGSFTVASSHELVAAISAAIKDHEVVIFDFSSAVYLDDSAAMLIRRLMDIAAQERTEFIVTGISGDVAHTLGAPDVLRDVPVERIVGTLEEARETAKNILGV